MNGFLGPHNELVLELVLEILDNEYEFEYDGPQIRGHTHFVG